MEMMVNEKKNTRHDGITVQPANMLSCYIYKIYGYFIQPPVAKKKKKDVFNLARLCDHDITFSERFQIGMAAAVRVDHLGELKGFLQEE